MNDLDYNETDNETDAEPTPVEAEDGAGHEDHAGHEDDHAGHNDALEDLPETASRASQPVDAELLRQIVEGALLAAGQPLSVARLLELFDEAVAPTKEALLAALDEVGEACVGRGFELKEVASGFRLQVRTELAPWVNRLWEEKPQRYSRALLETLALIAYRQPITRGDIEEIRGVAVSSHIMKTLLEREWVKVVGQRDVPGRPSLYATTRQFLDYFNLKSLDELPSLSEIRDLDELNAELDLGDQTLAADAAEPADAEPAEETREQDDSAPALFAAELDQPIAAPEDTDEDDRSA